MRKQGSESHILYFAELNISLKWSCNFLLITHDNRSKMQPMQKSLVLQGFFGFFYFIYDPYQGELSEFQISFLPQNNEQFHYIFLLSPR